LSLRYVDPVVLVDGVNKCPPVLPHHRIHEIAGQEAGNLSTLHWKKRSGNDVTVIFWGMRFLHVNMLCIPATCQNRKAVTRKDYDLYFQVVPKGRLA